MEVAHGVPSADGRLHLVAHLVGSTKTIHLIGTFTAKAGFDLQGPVHDRNREESSPRQGVTSSSEDPLDQHGFLQDRCG